LKRLDDLLLSLNGNDFQVKSARTCVFWTAVLSKSCGLSSTFRGEGPPHDRGVKFDHDIDAICGVKVIDAEKVIRSVSEGATFKEVTGVRLLTLSKR
jgi:uncharacterized protein (DUF4213/DUF364 family)